jgi:hypothetical protein
MRAFDRDLIRGGHYGQRSCEPHQQAEHMAAPTNAAFVKKVLAKSEPSTHGPSRQFRPVAQTSAARVKADVSGEGNKSSSGAAPLRNRRYAAQTDYCRHGNSCGTGSAFVRT